MAIRSGVACPTSVETFVGFRAVYVFDAQTDGATLPEPAEAGGDPGATTARLKAAILSKGIALHYVEGPSCDRQLTSISGSSSICML
jgi:hypothetical protein